MTTKRSKMKSNLRYKISKSVKKKKKSGTKLFPVNSNE